MASEKSGETVLSVHLPDELRQWLDEEAEQREIDRETLLEELIAANRAVLDGDGTPAGVELEGSAEGVSEMLLEERSEELREEFMGLIEDVRERVIQVKRETDTKAPLEHTHTEFKQLETLAEQLEDVEAGIDSLEEDLDTVETELEAGFENYEEVVEYLLDTTDAFEHRVDTLASAVVETRDQIRSFVSRHQQQALTDELKLAASQYGIEEADCEDCGRTLSIALLTRPECPHCASSFADVRSKSGLFGSATLETGSPPALTEGDDPTFDTALDEESASVDADDSAAEVNWQERGTNDERSNQQ